MRKRQVLLSRINIYIVIIIVSCHTIRIVPNVWEIVQACSGVNEEVDMNYRIRFVPNVWEIVQSCIGVNEEVK